MVRERRPSLPAPLIAGRRSRVIRWQRLAAGVERRPAGWAWSAGERHCAEPETAKDTGWGASGLGRLTRERLREASLSEPGWETRDAGCPLQVPRWGSGSDANAADGYLLVSILMLMMMSFLLSKELMDFTALFFPLASAQTS